MTEQEKPSFTMYIGAEIESNEERLQYLQSACDGVEKGFEYRKVMSDTERSDMTEILRDTYNELARLEEEKAEFMDMMKEKIKPLKKELRAISTSLRKGGDMVKEDVFKFYDMDSRTTALYNNEGFMVSRRSMNGQEVQFAMKFNTKTGTND